MVSSWNEEAPPAREALFKLILFSLVVIVIVKWFKFGLKWFKSTAFQPSFWSKALAIPAFSHPFVFIVGNSSTSRMAWESVSSITMRSMP